jgi:methyltransferase (TIGR00027 family)
LRAEPIADRRAVAVDLRDDWPRALRNAGFDPTVPTAWSAEGLLVYLPSDAQDRLFDNITALSAHGSVVACEYLPDMSVFEHPRLRERFAQSEINVGDLIYTGERTHVPDYLDRLGWRTTGRTSEELYAVNGLTYPDDEDLALFADLTYLAADLG